MNTWNWPCGAVEFHHAVDLSEHNTLARLYAVGLVVHTGHHPRIILKVPKQKGDQMLFWAGAVILGSYFKR